MDMATVSFALNHACPTDDSDPNASKRARAYQTASCTIKLQHDSLKSQ